ncbi:MAG: alpha/beta fold hydrolase [Chloroflexota bacterium]|nr:MAG: alpha/beta fold hydrolase [Chloroflexota bacterium]
MKEQYIDVNGWRTRYARAGDQGTAIILLHGLGASLESWYPNVDALGERYRAFAPDIVYFGKSAKPKRAPQYMDFVEFTIQFMDTFGLERAVLVGNSMGGAIATKIAILYPDRVAGLVLVDSAGFGPELAWWLRLRTLVDVRPRGTPPPWLTRVGLRAIFDDPAHLSDELLTKLIGIEQDDQAIRSARRVLKIGVDWRGLKPDMLREIRDAAHQVTVPTLIVWGKQDRVVPVQHAFAARKRIPNARLHLFERCGHTPQLEYPAQFNSLIHEFVQETGERNGEKI